MKLLVTIASIAAVECNFGYSSLFGGRGNVKPSQHHDHHHNHKDVIHNLHDLEVEHMEHFHDMHEQDFDDESFFRLHDLNNDRYLDEHELKLMYHGHSGPQSTAELMEGKQLVESIFLEVDKNRDRLLSLREFLDGLDDPLDHVHDTPNKYSVTNDPPSKFSVGSDRQTKNSEQQEFKFSGRPDDKPYVDYRRQKPTHQPPQYVKPYKSGYKHEEPDVYHLHGLNYGQGVKLGADIAHHPDVQKLHGQSNQHIFEVPDKFRVITHTGL